MGKLEERLYQAANQAGPAPDWARVLVGAGLTLLIIVAMAACAMSTWPGMLGH